MKEFEWQYKDEKLLLLRKENILHFLFMKKYHFLIFLIVFSIAIFTLYLFQIQNFYIFLFAFIIIAIFYKYNKLMYDNTSLILTTRRIIKKVRNGLFISHEKELLLGDVRQVTTRKNNFIETIFHCWNVTFLWAEAEWDLYFKGITDSKDVWNYATRILDYMKLNWHTDNISRYVSKKQRKKAK